MATLIQTLRSVLDSKDLLLPAETKRILIKEALQAYVLDFVYNHPAYRRLNFYGGTCLHVVYGLNRLSEDLDFDNSSEIDLSYLADDLSAYFRRIFGYGDTNLKTQQGSNEVLRVTLKFPLLNSLGLSSYSNESLHLKVEISHHKQIAVLQKTPSFYYGRSFVPVHFSLETMMAGKIIACLERNFQRGKEGAYIKGRDFYDLLWYMQKSIQPLPEKLAKDGKKPYTVKSAMQALQEKVQSIKVSD
ncbi:MAG: nucleotidyl transferase AbiEii/AbiGii toxin family protein, partial [Anaerolineales bacterium]